MSTRVAITGLGAITPIGANVNETWNNALAGNSGIVKLGDEWAEGLAAQIAGRVTQDPYEVLDRVQARRMDRSTQLGVIAAKEAWKDAGAPEIELERLGVHFGTGIGGLNTVIEQYEIMINRGADRVNPMTVPMIMPNSAAATVGLQFGARAGVHSPVSACATSAEAIAGGLEMIRNNKADVVIAGGTEACLNRLAVSAFAAMKALSTRNNEPEKASRPYDLARDGFVMGEGAGALILENENHAKARGAKIYGYLAGAGMSADGYHIAAPEPEGAGASRAINQALIDADLSSSDVAHINAHATSTPVGDIAEYKAMRRALGTDLDQVLVTATKSLTGHLLGGAGAAESILTILALANKQAPVTLNLENQDPEIPVNVSIKNKNQLPDNARVALNNSFGFGGHNV
ncbi:MAG: beta-ketoacyl-[acyl-carrier-protein] synthase family protein, partial [Candidatus Nanopelagicales bacterium]